MTDVNRAISPLENCRRDRDISSNNHLERKGPAFGQSRMRASQPVGRVAVTTVRIVLSGLAAIFIGLLGPGFVIALRDVSQQKGHGIGCNCRWAFGSYLLAAALVSCPFLFRLLLHSQSAQKQSAGGHFVLDSDCHYFVDGVRAVCSV